MVKKDSATITVVKKFLIIGSFVIVLVIGGGLIVTRSRSSKITNTQTETPAQSNIQSTHDETFDKTQHSLTDPTSIWLVVNKQYSIPVSFIPELTVPSVQLRLASHEEQMQINTTTEPAIKEMFNAAKDDGITLVFGSGYRSGALQKQFYDSYKAKDGQAAADTYSARPGHSEHQTGFAADITSVNGSCHLEVCWADTPEGTWLAANAYKYGFIIRYPKDKQDITGYQYEPWHVRYVGKELAAEINKTSQTLEEFFNLGPAPSYD